MMYDVRYDVFNVVVVVNIVCCVGSSEEVERREEDTYCTVPSSRKDM